MLTTFSAAFMLHGRLASCSLDSSWCNLCICWVNHVAQVHQECNTEPAEVCHNVLVREMRSVQEICHTQSNGVRWPQSGLWVVALLRARNDHCGVASCLKHESGLADTLSSARTSVPKPRVIDFFCESVCLFCHYFFVGCYPFSTESPDSLHFFSAWMFIVCMVILSALLTRGVGQLVSHFATDSVCVNDASVRVTPVWNWLAAPVQRVQFDTWF